jgi:hypothetical protein
MVSVNEIAPSQSAFSSAMRQGLEAIDRDQTITFTQYMRYVLPLDGYVFWIKTSNTVTVDGSLHYAINQQQNETETVAVNQVLFTAETEIQEFDTIAPNTIWIGDLGTAESSTAPLCETSPTSETLTPFPIKFAFSSRGSYYKQADIYHYVGTAIIPGMMSQIIDSAADLPSAPIVSNSLPIWLAQSRFGTVYPSFAVPNNIEPPYIVCHIAPDGTEPVQQFPDYTAGYVPNNLAPPAYLPGSPVAGTGVASPAIGQYTIGVSTIAQTPLYSQASRQLASDRVKLTLIGFNNQRALQYLSYLMQNSMDLDTFGFQNSPIVRDEKQTQVELAILQQRKVIEITASYYQGAADVIAQRLILQACASLDPNSMGQIGTMSVGESPVFWRMPPYL